MKFLPRVSARVAIFSQPGFPRYGVGWAAAPRVLQSDLKAAGIDADLLDISALADPAKFNSRLYGALALLDGNTFPDAAFANMQNFHRAGGSLIATGIPLTHPVVYQGGKFVDLGHRNDSARFGPGGIGIGGFAGPDTGKPRPIPVAPGDPWKLRGICNASTLPHEGPQWLDPNSVPAGVEIIPALGDARKPIAALLVHKTGRFAGAVDAWTYRVEAGERENYEVRQLLCRATVAVLSRKNALDARQTKDAFAALDGILPPKVYANVVLPTVPRRYETLQPKTPNLAKNLLVADIRTLAPDEKTLLFSLQGLVNRIQPREFTYLTDDDDQFWLSELQRQGEIDGFTMIADPFSLLATFRDAYKGAVVCDPNIYVSPCVAASICGADGSASRENRRDSRRS